jgi:thiol-disulfide isomerase/thioredoxin
MEPPAQVAGTAPPDWDTVDAKIAAFQKQYGAITLGEDHPIVAMLRSQEMGLLKQAGDNARYQSLLQKLSNDPMPEVAAMANDQIAAAKKLADLLSKPLDLKYTAVDGTEVDLSKLRGKVVLIDFWATWCPPCREEVPEVVAVYQKYHDKGFEIVGVSLDQSKDALLLFTKANGMIWPEYFDGKGWSNDISSRFGIDMLPAKWIVDKNGMVVSTDGSNDLSGQVEKLLGP